jgi:hypothetical protein
MKSFPGFLVITLLSGVIVVVSAQNNGWNGIAPLRSTRADVEQRLGESNESCRCRYRTAKETVFVEYAAAPCKGSLFGWNVKVDTVLQVTVYPKTKPHFSELSIDEAKYIKTRDDDDAVTVYYTSIDEGIRYAVQNGDVVHVEYRPSSKDKPLRCEGFPDYDGGIREYRPYASFSTKAQMMEERLDDFAVQLINRTSMKGYIVSYAGKTARRNEARIMAETAKQYLVSKRKLSADRLVAIDGGFRETAEYDLFLMPSTFPPPTATPTVPSNEVQIVRTARRNKRRSLSPPAK